MSKPNNTPEQKAAWEANKSILPRPKALPLKHTAFWQWGAVGRFHSRSKTPGAFKVKPVHNPRSLARHLNRGSVHRADQKGRNKEHQFKFLSRSQKAGFVLKAAIAR